MLHGGLAWLCCSLPAFAADESSASRVGAITPFSHDDPRDAPVAEGNAISGLADSFATAGSGLGSGFEVPKDVEFTFPGQQDVQEIDLNNKTITFTGAPVVIMKTNDGIEVFSKKAVFDAKAKTITMTGELAIFQKEGLSRADKAVYYYETKILKTQDVKAKINGLVIRSDEFNYEIDAKGDSYIIGHNASISAEDDQEPETWISGKKVRIYPEDSITFWDFYTDYADVPFFYFPYFHHSLNPREGYMPYFGARSNWGAFMLNKYGILFGDRRVERGRPTADYLSTLNFDYRIRRGFGLGVDLEDIGLVKRAGDMQGLSLYGVDDTDSTISPNNGTRPEGMEAKRWRIALQNMWQLPVDDTLSSEWRFKANINALSDEYMLRDFYQELYQSNPNPDNTLAITRTDYLTNLVFLQRIPLNDFYLSDQRTELSFDRIRGPLFGSSIIYESQSSASFLRQYVPSALRTDIRERLDNMSPDNPNREFWESMLITNGYFRVHTYHELSTSFKFWNFLNVTPKIGGGYTGYQHVEDIGSFNQGVFFASVDSYLKFSRRYNNVSSDMFGLQGMTHIIQPYATFAYIGANEGSSMLPRIDGYSPSTNPMSLSPGRITEIDSIATAAVLRYGVKNFLMTDRNGASHRWFSHDIFMDAYFHDTAEDRNFSNTYSVMNWDPLPWLRYTNIVQVPLFGSDRDQRYREYNNYLTFMLTRSLDVIVGHRYLSQHLLLEDSSQLDVKTIYRINEEFAVSGAWRWELETGKIDIQEYHLYKNMGSWYFGTGLYMRRNGSKDEVGFGISFTLKDSGTYMPVKFY